jgi:hypothetical protein
MAAKASPGEKPKPKRKSLTVRVDEEIMRRFRHYCVDADLSGEEVVTRWIKRNCPPRPEPTEASSCVSA